MLNVPRIGPSTLTTAYLKPKWVRVVMKSQLEAVVVVRQCHYYHASSDGTADLFRQSESMEFVRFASYNNVMLIEEVDGPPIPEPEPAVEAASQNEEIPAEVVLVPAKPVSDDDIPF
jgi:hypothetical protein